MNKLSVGTSFDFPFRLTPEQVESYAKLSGDRNPIHFDQEAATRSAIGKISVQGMLGGFVFSRVLGTLFPGYGTVYRFQSLQFRRPMFVETDYVATVKVLKVVRVKHVARLSTIIIEKTTGQVTTRGHAIVVHLQRF